MAQSTWEDPQMQIIGNLCLLQFLRTLLPDPLPPPTGTNDKTLRMLNWIASSFVREEQGDCVAAALATSAGHVTLYLAANRGKPEQKDVDNTTNFLTALREAMKIHKHTRNIGGAGLLLMRHAITASTKRLARKLESISTTAAEGPRYRETDVVANPETFESLLKRWGELPNAPKEDLKLAHFSRMTFPGVEGLPPNEMLLRFFRELIELCKTGSKQARACALAEAVAKSRFFESLSDSNPTPHFLRPERDWLLKLKRRIWRVAHYGTDAVLVVREAFDLFTMILGDNIEDFLGGGSGISIEWAGDDADILPSAHGVDLTWPSSSKERLQEFLIAKAPDYKLPQGGDFRSSLGKVFTRGHTVRPKFHCEAQLIYYLQRKNIRVVGNAVGVSKLACFACKAYVDSVNATLGSERWQLPGCSNKYHYAWAIPRNGNQIVEVVERRMMNVLEELARQNILLRARANSAGSDSSGGERSEGEDGDDAELRLFQGAITSD